MSLAKRIARDDSLAEDVLQTSWIKILQSINHACFDGPKACPWVHRIVTKTAKDFHGKQVRRREDPLQAWRNVATRNKENTMKRQILALVLAALVLAIPGQAEWFDQGKVAYKTPYKKWRSAAIHVEPGKIEVYNRKERVLVAEFTEAASVEHKTRLRRRWREALLFGTTVVGGYVLEFARASINRDVVELLE